MRILSPLQRIIANSSQPDKGFP
ncbi:protein of unknown function [Cupriavidus taiwanensis]|uniref:Uncharacterized protein n=1 Tax=Cupriavidus taiwanensis TaxID=164546 RepID=A0A7Z7NLD4_9BURK|nr:protein of unknown function [Cupriavidus taiwanensis]SOZ01834.1 hypothetical protein CBM2595_A30656 [Cupriavidus taiwanensis]SOZ04833.1 hypothetical protein CBM2597_A50785 [Cupriavidus taiwanensis]SPC09316.1 hypothetical protein CBM2594_A40639 [Cupriavidus taiwanensis]